MIKGVPLDTSDADILEDIKKIDNMAEVDRLYKNGKKLRFFRVKFSNNDFYNKALSSDISHPSAHILCHAEAML